MQRFADKKLTRFSTRKHKKNHQTRESESERERDRETYEVEEQRFASENWER